MKFLTRIDSKLVRSAPFSQIRSLGTSQDDIESLDRLMHKSANSSPKGSGNSSISSRSGNVAAYSKGAKHLRFYSLFVLHSRPNNNARIVLL